MFDISSQSIMSRVRCHWPRLGPLVACHVLMISYLLVFPSADRQRLRASHLWKHRGRRACLHVRETQDKGNAPLCPNTLPRCYLPLLCRCHGYSALSLSLSSLLLGMEGWGWRGVRRGEVALAAASASYSYQCSWALPPPPPPSSFPPSFLLIIQFAHC